MNIGTPLLRLSTFLDISARKCLNYFMVENTALLIIDLQKDFCYPNSAYSKLGYPTDQNLKLANKILKQVDRIQSLGIKIIYILSDYEAYEIQGKRCLFCHSNSEGSKSFLPMNKADKIVTKKSHDGFYKTELENYLKENNILNILVAGISTSVCVDSTARSAVCRGYSVTILEDLVASRDNKLHKSALKNFKLNFGFVNYSRNILKEKNGCKTTEKGARHRDKGSL